MTSRQQLATIGSFSERVPSRGRLNSGTRLMLGGQLCHQEATLQNVYLLLHMSVCRLKGLDGFSGCDCLSPAFTSRGIT